MTPDTAPPVDPLDVKLSVTDMSRCHHGPVRNCPRCLVTELVDALELALEWAGPDFGATWARKARAVLDKARKMVGDDARDLDKRPQDAAETLAEVGRERRALGEEIRAGQKRPWTKAAQP